MATASRVSPSPWSRLRHLFGLGAAAERLVLAAIPHAVLTVDAHERVAYANPAAQAVLRASLGTAIGQSLHGAFEAVTSEGSRACALCAALGESSVLSDDVTLVAGDRRTLVRFECAPIMSDGQRVGVVIALDPQPPEAEVERRQRERVTRDTRAIIADLAHELNNPLTVILASAGMLREHADGDDVRRRVDLILEAADRCVGIVRTFRASLAAPPPEPVTAPPPSPPPPIPARAPRAHILVVDDDALVASAMAAALAAEGHAVDIASDGLAALARVSTRLYDVILTDVRMPRLDGPALYHELGRVRPELLSRVIFVTGDTLSPTTRNFLATVAAPSVRKPFEPRQIRSVVRQLLATAGKPGGG